MTTTSNLMSTLQQLWGATPVESTSLQECGLAVTPCKYHIPPFDEVESIDQTRRSWICLRCRRCGRFLGYRPQSESVQLLNHG